jgi:DNA polymerase III epsilon subunit-like protein
VFFDLETTGTDIFRDEIVELAAIKAHLREGRIHELGHFHSLVNPGYPIPADASAVHGIRDEDVRKAPSIRDILPRFLEFIGDSPLAGHNVDSYDIPILRRVAGKHLSLTVLNLSLDTLPLSRRLFPGESHTLGALAQRLGVDADQAHRALSDVRTNIGVFMKLIEIDESMRARAFSPAVPIALAVAHAVDDNAEQDPTWLRQAAARAISPYASDPLDFPFLESASENLTPHARKHVESIVDKLTRVPLEPDEAEHLLRARIEFLQEEAVRLEKDRFDLGLPEFLAHIALLTEGDFESDEDAVRMMTLHAAKGLEFDRVILLGLEHGNLPHRLALNKSMSEVEEERRLFYVGLTRARQRAALVYARRRFGRWRPPSMFLGELPQRAVRRHRTKDRVSGK